jgi:hypothetical protein
MQRKESQMEAQMNTTQSDYKRREGKRLHRAPQLLSKRREA